MDETGEHKDTSQSGDTSSGEQGTSKEDTQTFTKEERDKAVSDALAVAGRTAKELAQLGESTKADRTQLNTDRKQWQKTQDETELESARDNPDKLTAIQVRQKQRERDTELDRREQELNERAEKNTEALKEVEKYTKERNAREIATRLNVDSETLVKFTDGSTEAMEELAKSLPKMGDTKDPLRPDSGKTIGGENWRELSSDDKLRKALK